MDKSCIAKNRPFNDIARWICNSNTLYPASICWSWEFFLIYYHSNLQQKRKDRKKVMYHIFHWLRCLQLRRLPPFNYWIPQHKSSESLSQTSYPLVNKHSNGKSLSLNRKYIFKGSIFQPAMLDYRSVSGLIVKAILESQNWHHRSRFPCFSYKKMPPCHSHKLLLKMPWIIRDLQRFFSNLKFQVVISWDPSCGQ